MGQDILRGITWRFASHTAKIRWESRLAVITDLTVAGLDESTVDEDGKPANHALIEYEWSLVHHPKGLPLKVVKTFRCGHDSGSLGNEPGRDDAMKQQKGQSPWAWQEFEGIIENLHRGDLILITAKLVSDQPKAAAQLFKCCMVKARQCQVYGLVGGSQIISDMTNAEFNALTPALANPLAVYSSMHYWRPPHPYEKSYNEEDTWERTFHLFHLSGAVEGNM